MKRVVHMSMCRCKGYEDRHSGRGGTNKHRQVVKKNTRMRGGEGGTNKHRHVLWYVFYVFQIFIYLFLHHHNFIHLHF